MDLFIVLIFIVGALVLAAVINSISTQNRIKRFIVKLKKNFGKLERKEYDPEKYTSYRGYFIRHLDDEGFIIDDITWNDAEGETLYTSINKSYSSCGDEYLYYRLRHIDIDAPKEERDRFIYQTDSLILDEVNRIKLQLNLATLGKTGRHSVFEYISLLSKVKRVPLILFYIVWIVYALIIASFFYNVTLGVCLTIVWMIVCVFIYLSHKKSVENYITSFEYIVRTIITAEKIAGLKVPYFDKECEELLKQRKELKGVKTSYLSFIKQSNRAGITDMMSGMTAMLNCFFLIDIFFFYKMLKYVCEKEDAYDKIFEILGKIETQISVANLKASFENTCVPSFSDENVIKGVDMIHPLVNNCVANSFENKKGMLITGSNASGKSTFLRSVLVNALLSETVYVACAKEFSLRPSLLFSSMSLSDSLSSGESYYMAEINSIKRILDAKEEGKNIICFLDEVLRGTNTVERVAAATEILRYLTGENIITIAATHDIELTYLLEKDFDNCFFREEIRKDEDDKEDIYFSYKINNGRSETRNALLLLKMKGYPEEIYKKAEGLSKAFMDTGKWQYDEG